MKVYLVASGEYSDYCVVGLFSTLEKAEAFRAAFPAEGYSRTYHDPVEYDLDMPLPDPAQRGLHYFSVRMNRNGDVESVEGEGYDDQLAEGMRYDWRKQEWNCNAYVDLPKDRWVGTFLVWARDKEHAVKVANEWRIQAIANEPPPPSATPEQKP